MNNKQNETNQPKEKETFLKIFPNVKRCKTLDWIERALLSNYLSFQVQGNEFYQTDSRQAMELGLSPAQVSKYTGRLKERGIIDTRLEYEENTNGGRPIPVRYVTVIEMDKWTTGDKVPAVNKFVSATEKKKALKAVAYNSINKTEEVNTTKTTSINEAETKPIVKPKQVKREQTLEEMLREAEAKEKETVNAEVKPAPQPKETNTTPIEELKPVVQEKPLSIQTPTKESGVLELDLNKHITTNQFVYEQIIEHLNGGKVYTFIPVKVLHSDRSITNDEAMLLPSYKDKYALKSKLLKMKPNLFPVG